MEQAFVGFILGAMAAFFFFFMWSMTDYVNPLKIIKKHKYNKDVKIFLEYLLRSGGCTSEYILNSELNENIHNHKNGYTFVISKHYEKGFRVEAQDMLEELRIKRDIAKKRLLSSHIEGVNKARKKIRERKAYEKTTSLLREAGIETMSWEEFEKLGENKW